MSLRISSGSLKNLQLASPLGVGTRPTGAKTREAVWSMIRPQVEKGFVFIDLFSGSGIMGLEAASNGAGQVVFCETNRSALRTLAKNVALAEQRLDKLAREDCCKFEIVAADAFRLLWHGKTAADILWADPPYAEVIPRLDDLESAALGMLGQQGLWYLESARTDAPSIAEHFLNSGALALNKQKFYGETAISILERP